MPSRPLIVPLTSISRDWLSIAGGKGANLGELLRAGVSVPDGFVVTTAAYTRNIQTGSVAESVARQADSGNFTGLRTTIETAEVDTGTREAIVTAYHEMGAGPVAVRSSGTAEDLADAAFAGQHDTYLNIVGDDDVVDAVRRCWASLWTDRAAEYRRQRGIASSEVAIAVVLQKMVQSESAGVMFTADPVSGQRDRLVIDASPGLGESVVSGLVTPDHYVAAKKNGKVISSSLGRREVVIRSVAGGGTVESHDETVDGPVLDTTRIRELVKLGRAIENHYGAPQDTEWALVDGKFYIVQARPITAMPEPIGKVSVPRRMLAGILAEILTKRPYPLDITTWTTDMFNGVRRFAACMGVRFPTLESMLVTDTGVVVRLDAKGPRPMVRTPFVMVRNLVRGGKFPLDSWQDDPRVHQYLADIKRLRAKDLSVASYEELDSVLSQALAVIGPVMDMRYDYLPRGALAAVRLRITLARFKLGQSFALLLTGAFTKTEETNRELAKLAERVRVDERLAADFARHDAADLGEVLAGSRPGREFLIAFDAFLDDFGHREITSIALASEPVWRDSPHTVLGIIKGMAAADKPGPSESAAERAYAELLRHPKLRNDRRKAKVLNRLASARLFTSFREDTHFYLTMPQPIVRRILLEYAARLGQAGVIDTPMDVFHLRREELSSLAWPPSPAETARLRAQIAERAAVRERLGEAPMVDRRYFASGKTDPDAIVTGMPASGGRYTGCVRVIDGPEAFHSLCDGEVLVAPFTNPAWTPLFQRAGAVIVDTGGPMSHAAIVAREYGIPAILGTGSAVSIMSDGDMVTVDGDSGSVKASAPIAAPTRS